MKKLFYLLLLLIPIQSLSWNSEGHRYSGIIAYELLSQEVRDAVIKDLKEHHMFEAHFKNEMPEDVKAADIEIQNRWLFSQMAVWPDHIKNRSLGYSPVRRKWHYINLPILLTQIDQRYYKDNIPVNTERTYEGEASNDWNISQAYLYNADLIKDTTGSEKAISLCWIFHLTGDVHQPLHTSALFNEGRFIKGDMGGNAISVKGMGSLHTYWDRATYTTGSKKWTFEQHIEEAQRLIEVNQSEGAACIEDMTFESWITESHSLALEIGYPQVMLDKIKHTRKEQHGFKNPLKLKMDKDYVKEWKLNIRATSKLRVTLAGYRIAEFLKLVYE